MAIIVGVFGPFGSSAVPASVRFLYWALAIGGGAVIGVVLDWALARVVPGRWPRVLAVAALMTPPVMGYVLALNRWLLDPRSRLSVEFGVDVFAMAFAVMAVRALVWRPPPAPVTRTVVETRVEAPLPEAEAAFRRRLSAKRRGARLIAVEAEDHYLRVHTDAGDELIAMRFTDAMTELALADGLQVHRSWWVAADAIEAVSWRRGVGEARLAGGLLAPISRSHAARVREAGWR